MVSWFPKPLNTGPLPSRLCARRPRSRRRAALRALTVRWVEPPGTQRAQYRVPLKGSFKGYYKGSIIEFYDIGA